MPAHAQHSHSLTPTDAYKPKPCFVILSGAGNSRADEASLYRWTKCDKGRWGYYYTATPISRCFCLRASGIIRT